VTAHLCIVLKIEQRTVNVAYQKQLTQITHHNEESLILSRRLMLFKLILTDRLTD